MCFLIVILFICISSNVIHADTNEEPYLHLKKETELQSHINLGLIPIFLPSRLMGSSDKRLPHRIKQKREVSRGMSSGHQPSFLGMQIPKVSTFYEIITRINTIVASGHSEPFIDNLIFHINRKLASTENHGNNGNNGNNGHAKGKSNNINDIGVNGLPDNANGSRSNSQSIPNKTNGSNVQIILDKANITVINRSRKTGTVIGINISGSNEHVDGTVKRSNGIGIKMKGKPHLEVNNIHRQKERGRYKHPLGLPFAYGTGKPGVAHGMLALLKGEVGLGAEKFNGNVDNGNIGTGLLNGNGKWPVKGGSGDGSRSNEKSSHHNIHNIDINKLTRKQLHSLLEYLKGLKNGKSTFKPPLNQLCCIVG